MPVDVSAIRSVSEAVRAPHLRVYLLLGHPSSQGRRVIHVVAAGYGDADLVEVLEGEWADELYVECGPVPLGALNGDAELRRKVGVPPVAFDAGDRICG